MKKTRTTHEARHADVSLSLIACALLTLFAVAQSAFGDELLKVWATAYQALNPGESPRWTSRSQAEAWAVAEQERLEPVLLEMLRGEVEGTPWGAALSIAQVIPTPRICEVLLVRMQEILARYPDGRITQTSEDISALVRLLTILAEADYEPSQLKQIATHLACQERQPSRIVEECVVVLRKLGDAESLAAIREVPLRKEDPCIDRLCIVTERVIDARLRGETVCPNAQAELRALAETFIRAIQTKDYKTYVRAMRWRFERGSDEPEVRREVFENPEALALAEKLKESLDHPFDIEPDELQAHLLFGDGYKLECVYDADGWRIARIARAGP
jgi:hypothetical protein